MKKIGILFGQEHSFPPAFVERVNQKTGGKDIVAEFVKIDKVMQGEPCGYDVVIDRISQDVPFLSRLAQERGAHRDRCRKQSVLVERRRKIFQQRAGDEDRRGSSAHCAAAIAINRRRTRTTNHFAISAYPLDWEAIFDYVGWPAFFKPFAGGGWKNVYRLHNPRRILPRLQRHRPTGDDVAGGSEIRHVFPLLLDRSAPRPHHALRAAASVSFALPNRMAGARKRFCKRSRRAFCD